MKFSLKELIIGGVAAGGTVLVLWLWREAVPLIIARDFKDYSFIAPAAGLIVAGGFFTLSAIFIREAKVVYPLLIAGIIIPFFFLEASGTILAVLAANLFITSFAIYRIRQEHLLSYGFSLSKIAKTGLPLYFTAVSLMVSSFYLVNMDEELAISGLLPRPAVNFAFNLVSQVLPGPAGFPREMLELNADDFYEAMVLELQQILGPYQRFLPLASALIFFFAFKAFTVPVYYLTLIFIFLLLKLLVFSKIVNKEKLQIEVERLSL